MQQVEQGKVDLNADVNKYIDFKIPPYEGKPVTVLNLMTHTPGFEEAVKNLITLGPKEVPFDTLLKNWVPNRIYAPGTTPAYSNYGASLAGYIVQRTSGEPFDSYLEHHIFGPLGMAHSTFRQPLPANLGPLMAEGYIPGKDTPKGFEFVNAAPAGALSASGDDMAKFMIAHLQNGQYNGQTILKPQTAVLMHSRANTPFAAGDGMAHGFYETGINGLHVIAHGGDTEAFHSDLHLFLDKGVGIFVSFNSPGKEGTAGPLRDSIFSSFADRYFPEPANLATKAIPNGAKEDAQKLAGVYSTTRGARSNFLAALDLLGQTKVGVDKDGNPLLPDAKGLGGQPRKWVHVGPMTWRDADGHDLLHGECRRRQGDPLQLWRTGPDHRFRSDSGLPLVGLDPAAALLLARDPADHRLAVADAAAGPAQIQGRLRPRPAPAACLPLEPDRGDPDRGAPHRLAARRADDARRPCQPGDVQLDPDPAGAAQHHCLRRRLRGDAVVRLRRLAIRLALAR